MKRLLEYVLIAGLLAVNACAPSLTREARSIFSIALLSHN